jgi:hypothetical protein
VAGAPGQSSAEQSLALLALAGPAQPISGISRQIRALWPGAWLRLHALFSASRLVFPQILLQWGIVPFPAQVAVGGRQAQQQGTACVWWCLEVMVSEAFPEMEFDHPMKSAYHSQHKGLNSGPCTC